MFFLKGKSTVCDHTKMRIFDNLKAGPSDYVAKLDSSIGIYLRRRIFQEDTESDRALEKKLYQKITADQSMDGSWDQLFVKTANNLWDLALLGYTAKDRGIRKALEWLLSIQRHQYKGYPGFFHSRHKDDPRVMRSTSYGEFGPGCTVFYQTTYALHLFHIFGFDDNKRVQRTVKSYLQFWKPDWCGTWCTINVLRVLIEHPLSKDSTQVESGLEHLAVRQTKKGTWKNFPFYHTFHALSRTDQASGKRQFERAIPSVVTRQNRNGSWGRKKYEMNTFLVLDALKNAGKV